MEVKRIKPIKTEADYEESLVLLEELIDAAPATGTVKFEQLEILTSLIEAYEDDHYNIDTPSAIEAIKFAMEQQDLEQKDLIPLIGTKGRVSEILSGKRSLSIEMIRTLESSLGIPAKALIKKPNNAGTSSFDSWDDKVFIEMKKRGYFQDLKDTVQEKAELLRMFFESINHPSMAQALLRQSSYRTKTSDRNALAAWAGFVIKQADTIKANDYSPIDGNFLTDLAKLSANSYGPIEARDLLLQKGIKLVIEPVFPKTRIDGATIFTESNPIIGLTLRHDRIDNFWFTLMHELSHIVLHSNNVNKIDVFYDEIYEGEKDSLSDLELEADDLAGEALIPLLEWESSAAHLIPSEITFDMLANKLHIHIAIIAGKYRYETKDYTKFSDIVKINKVEYLFRED